MNDIRKYTIKTKTHGLDNKSNQTEEESNLYQLKFRNKSEIGNGKDFKKIKLNDSSTITTLSEKR